MSRGLLVLCLAWIGGVAGLSLGGLVTPADSGLAGSASVLGYGLVALVLGTIAGGLAAWTLSNDAVRPLSRGALALSLIVFIGLVVMVMNRQRAREDLAQQETAQRRAPFSLSAVTHNPENISTFVRIDIDGKRDTFEMTDRRKPGHPVCRGVVGPAHHTRVLDALRRADDLVERSPSVCDNSGEVVSTYRWTLPERGGVERVVGLTQACNAAHSEFEALYVPIEGIAFTADLGPAGLDCGAKE